MLCTIRPDCSLINSIQHKGKLTIPPFIRTNSNEPLASAKVTRHGWVFYTARTKMSGHMSASTVNCSWAYVGKSTRFQCFDMGDIFMELFIFSCSMSYFLIDHSRVIVLPFNMWVTRRVEVSMRLKWRSNRIFSNGAFFTEWEISPFMKV